MSREEKTTIFQVLMPVLMAMANTVMGGVIWLLLAYISGCGLIYTMIHVLS